MYPGYVRNYDWINFDVFFDHLVVLQPLFFSKELYKWTATGMMHTSFFSPAFHVHIFGLFLLNRNVSVFLFVIFLFATHTFMHFSAICRTTRLKILVSWNLLIYLVPPRCLICLCLLIELSYLKVGSSYCCNFLFTLFNLKPSIMLMVL